jgi:hypothetical protein
MDKEKTKKNHCKEVIENVTVIYTDGITEQFEAIRLIQQGIVIGRIKEGEFVPFGFINHRNIRNINKGRKGKSQ